MKKKLTFVSLILLTALLLFSQTATKQAWDDFSRVIGHINGLQQGIENIHAQIELLEGLKVEIMDATARKNELVKILNIHPDYSVDWVKVRIDKLTKLKDYLEANNFIQ